MLNHKSRTSFYVSYILKSGLVSIGVVHNKF